MYTVIRHYAGAPTLADELKTKNKDIENEIGSVSGFISYNLLKTSDGALSITTCEDRRGCDESSTRAANWLRKNLPNMKLSPPQIITGDVAFRFSKTAAKV